MKQTLSELKRGILDYLCFTPEIDKAMNEILKQVGMYFHVDRAYVFENSEDGIYCSNTFEWCNEGVEPEIDNLQNVNYEEDLGGNWIDNYDKNGLFYCKDIKKLSKKQRAILEPQNIKSMLHCSIGVGGEMKGYIGFDSCGIHKNSWVSNTDAMDTLVYISHLMSLYLMDYRHVKHQIAKKERKMQHQLQQANDLFEDLMNNVNCGIAIYRVLHNGEVQLGYINDGFCEMAQCTRENAMEIFENNHFFLMSPDYKEDITEAFNRVIQEEKSSTAICEIVKKSGERCWIMVKFSSSKKADGTTFVYASFIDITNEKETEIELNKKYEVERRRSRESRTMLAYAAFNLRTGEPIEMEQRAPLTPLTEMKSMNLFREEAARNVLTNSMRKEFLRYFDCEQLMKDYKKGKDQKYLELQVKLPSGKVIWVHCKFLVMIEPGGTDPIFLFSCRDINQNKSLEIMTKYMSNEDYDMLGCINFQDDSAVMLYGKNSSFRMKGDRKVQREENYTKALEWFIQNAVVPEEREQYQTKLFVKKIKDTLDKQESYEFSLHVMDEKRGIRTKKIRYANYDKESGICLFTQTDITDILEEEEKKRTELQDALDMAKRANESKTEFFSRMSHDMRTPMNGILGLANLSEDETNPHILKQNIRKIKASGEYLLALINDTLDFQKIESGKLHLEPKVVNCKEDFQNMLNMLKPALEKKKIELDMVNHNVDFSLYTRVDPIRLTQIFINLLSNAIKFSPEESIITLECECVKREGNISKDRFMIRDHGIGMSEEFMKNSLFKPFAQENNEVTGLYAGSGLGLSIVKSLVELMGGRIEVESKEGYGTTFTLWLDFERIQPDEVHSVREKKTKHHSTICKSLIGKKILLAEDHPLNAEIAKKLLEKEGCEVTWVENGTECIRLFDEMQKNYYDVILMDIRMPILDGIETTKVIRSRSRDDAASVPIIAMTANAYDEDVRKCLEAGMNAHIPKPIEPEVMFETILEQLQN